MGWNVIRKATAAELDAVRAAAVRFANRHQLTTDQIGAFGAVELATRPGYGADMDEQRRCARLRKLWRAIMRRTVGSPDGVADGWVGLYTPH